MHWFKDAPDVQQLLSATDDEGLIEAAEQIIAYVDSLISTHEPWHCCGRK